MAKNLAVSFDNIDFVFLDRDGVINVRPPLGQYIIRCEDFVLLPGVEQAIAALNHSGRKVLVVSNQRGVALGLYTAGELERMHQKLQAQLARFDAHVDGIYICPHDAGQCNCRKPLTGLFEQAFADFPDARPQSSIMAGDSLRDIEAGHRAGMATVLVRGGYLDQEESQRAAELTNLSVESLEELVTRHFCPPKE